MKFIKKKDVSGGSNRKFHNGNESRILSENKEESENYFLFQQLIKNQSNFDTSVIETSFHGGQNEKSFNIFQN